MVPTLFCTNSSNHGSEAKAAVMGGKAQSSLFDLSKPLTLGVPTSWLPLANTNNIKINFSINR